MEDSYEPTSEFLRHFAGGNVPLSGNEFADANLRRLIQMTRDRDLTNRDWATFILAQADVDTAAVRDALLRAATDEDEMVRAEALCGLARRDASIALPFVLAALDTGDVIAPIFEAAALCAHRSLVEPLMEFSYPTSMTYLRDLVAKALIACETGVRIE